MPSELRVASLAQYSVRGQSDESIRSQKVCRSLKKGTPSNLDSLINRLLALLDDERYDFLAPYFSEGVTFVPTPGSSPRKGNELWVPLEICKRLVNAGLGSTYEPLVLRHTAIPKSSVQTAENRPSLEHHLRSMQADGGNIFVNRIVLVDDVVTRGRTLFAAAQTLHETFPAADISAFSALRTLSHGDIDQVVLPMEEVIYCRESDTLRR